ncbi:MAG: hypothetical protein DRJ38_06210 [Thermoprotei archaeon]|nr:MAG: hypothetical protein DRJ38_06210 [Thermoprotei archaeon]
MAYTEESRIMHNATAQTTKEYIVIILIGLVTSTAIALFLKLFQYISTLIDEILSMNNVLLFLTVPIGLLAAYLVVIYLAEIKKTGCGTHGFLLSYHFHEGFASLKDTIVKATASAITMGCGGSAGLEGPSLAIGGGIASAIARLFKVREEKMARFFLAGGAAGLSAVFRAPLTGLLFALEIPYKRDIERDVFVDAAIASVISYLVFVSIYGVETLFPLYTKILPITAIDVIYALILGVIAGVIGKIFVVSFLFVKHRIVRIRNRNVKFFLPIIGGLLLALIGFIEPRVLGVGYETIHDLILGRNKSILLLILLIIFKIIATTITLNFGGSGGLFIPSIYVGAALGALFAFLTEEPVEVYVMVGMTAVLAATNKTLLTAVAFTAETVGPASIIPSLIAATTSYFLSGSESFYDLQPVHRPTEKIHILQDLYHRLSTYNPRILKEVKVKEVMVKPIAVLDGRMRINEAINKAQKYAFRIFPVISDDGRLEGFVALEDLLSFTEKSRNLPVSLANVRPVLKFKPEDSIGYAIEKMFEENMDKAAVVDEEDRLIGIITTKDILRKLAVYRLR